MAIIDELAELVDGGLMMPTGPRFFGWVIGGRTPLAWRQDWLTSAWGQNAGNHPGRDLHGRRYGLARATRDAPVGHRQDHPRSRWRYIR